MVRIMMSILRSYCIIPESVIGFGHYKENMRRQLLWAFAVAVMVDDAPNPIGCTKVRCNTLYLLHNFRVKSIPI